MEWSEKVANKLGVKVHHDDNTKSVLGGLAYNLEKYGARYCPCQLEKSKDHICPCKQMRDGRQCFCGLFVKREDNA